MIKIISFHICPFVQRVTAMLEAKEIAYEMEYIQLSNKPDWFLTLSPTGQVPVLITESGAPLFESDAIVEYIHDIYGDLALAGSPTERAQQRAWSYQATKLYLTQCNLMRSEGQSLFETRLTAFHKALENVEQALGEATFFNGEVISRVDIAWLPLLHRADIIRHYTGVDMLDGFPKTQAWQARLLAEGIAERSVSDEFEALFTGFYLSESTYLGQQYRLSRQTLTASERTCVEPNHCKQSACC